MSWQDFFIFYFNSNRLWLNHFPGQSVSIFKAFRILKCSFMNKIIYLLSVKICTHYRIWFTIQWIQITAYLFMFPLKHFRTFTKELHPFYYNHMGSFVQSFIYIYVTTSRIVNLFACSIVILWQPHSTTVGHSWLYKGIIEDGWWV